MTFKINCASCKIKKGPEDGDRCPKCNQLWRTKPLCSRSRRRRDLPESTPKDKEVS